MEVLELVHESNDVLKKPCVDFDFANPPFDPVEFSQNLVHTMMTNNGLGLAANQVGVPYRIFAMRGDPQHFVCFNPKIIYTGDENIFLEEGCLSFPGLITKIKRPAFIRVRFATPNGEITTKGFYGLAARVFQHELDHLDGQLFYNKATIYHREQSLKKRAIGNTAVDDIFGSLFNFELTF
jgi:peptide deformylase